MHTVELPTYRLTINWMCYFLVNTVFGALFCAIAVILKLADHVLPLFPIWIIPKSRQLIVIKAAAALF